MVFFKYGFVFLLGAGLGAAMARSGEHHHRHGGGHCWRRHHWCHRGGDDRWNDEHQQEPAAASYGGGYERERRGYDYVRPDTAADRDTEGGEYRSMKKTKKSAAAAADSM